MSGKEKTREELAREVEDLRARLDEAEEALRAIRSGEVDALVVAGPQGDQVFSLKGTEAPYRVLIEEMNEGAVTLSAEGVILYCNGCFSELVKTTPDRVMGVAFSSFLAPNQLAAFAALGQAAQSGRSDGEITGRAVDGMLVPLHLSLNSLPAGSIGVVCVVATDLTEVKGNEKSLRQAYDELEQRTATLAKTVQELEISQAAALNMMEDAVAAGSALEAINRDLQRQITERTRAEQALRASEERYRLIAENAADVIWTMDLVSGRMTFVSPSVEKLRGFTAEEVTAQSFEASFTPESARRVEARIAAGLAAFVAGDKSALSSRIEVEMPSKDGRVIPAEIVATGLIDDNGRVTTVLGVTRDISERKRAEDALRRSEERYRTILQEMMEGYYEVDIKGNMTFCNDALTRSLGYPREELMGLNYRSYLDKANAKGVNEVFDRVYRTGEPTQAFGYEVIRKDGTRIVVEASVALLRDAGGRTVGFRGVVRDVTERKQAEEALRESEERYGDFVEHVPVGVYRTSPDGRPLAANAALLRMLGFDSFTELSRVDLEREGFPHDQARLAFKSAIERDGEVRGYESVWLTRDKRILTVRENARVLRRPDGAVICYEGIAEDITERKQAEEKMGRAIQELERSNRELEQFAYVASHDLQEPLRMVSSYTQLLAQRYGDRLDQDAREFIAFAVDGAKRMQRLISDLLAFSRVTTRGKTFEPVDAGAALGEGIRNLSLVIDEAGALVTADDLPTVRADYSQLASVFQNLIGNALKFRREGVTPRIHVSAVQRDGEWLFSVRDNGIGIAPEYFERIFVIFQRLHTIDTYAGTGIGLALCKRIVERHGGRIWLESELGKGCTFYFTLVART